MNELEISEFDRAKLLTPIPRFISSSTFIANRFKLLDFYEKMRGDSITSKATILMYHHFWDSERHPWRLEQISKKDFENQIIYLSKQYNIVSLNEIVNCIQNNKDFPERAVAITFDDGNKDNYLDAYPILKKYNLPATIFLPSDIVNTKEMYWWDKVGYIIYRTTHVNIQTNKQKFRTYHNNILKLNDLEEVERNQSIDDLSYELDVNIPTDLGKDHILSWNEVREMSNNNIDFGSHTANHPFLTKLSLREAERQIIESKKTLEEELGQDISAFAYPYGDYNNSLKKILKKNGFSYAVTVDPRLISLKSDPYELGRIPPGWSFDTFKFYLRTYPDLKSILGRVSFKMSR